MNQKVLNDDKGVFYEQVTDVKGLFFVFSFIGLLLLFWLRCSPPGFYSHSG